MLDYPPMAEDLEELWTRAARQAEGLEDLEELDHRQAEGLEDLEELDQGNRGTRLPQSLEAPRHE